MILLVLIFKPLMLLAPLQHQRLARSLVLAELHSNNPPTGLEPGSLLLNNQITIDTSSPATTISNVEFDPDSNNLLLTGSNFK